MVFKESLCSISADQAMGQKGATIIDLRSPSEFEEDHLPGAHNVPLFDDLERALVGTLYARASPQAAFEAGRTLVLSRIEELVAAIGKLAGWQAPPLDLKDRVRDFTALGIESLQGELQWEALQALPRNPVLLYCWRGGLRSKSVVALLSAIGMRQALGIEGGYKAYRSQVLERLGSWQAPPVYVLRGLTGVGKTLVLREIEVRRPGWTLDLEALAGHRSSILGMVGLEPVSQKSFDTRLCSRLEAGFPGPCVVEGESRKVGDVIIPSLVWESMRSGVDLELAAPLERRQQVLIDDYLEHAPNREKLAQQLPFIEERLGRNKWAGRLVGLLRSGNEAQLVQLLLEHYYDPLYQHSESKHDCVASFDTLDEGRAAQSIIDWIESQSD